jgi:hypothetical protein
VRLAPAASMPLLAKELTELAARRRTYIVRVLYAALLFTGFLLHAHQLVWSGVPTMSQVLGRGRDIFEALIFMQFAGVLLFLPPTMSAVIASEKERDSLSLLLLTGLRPNSILFQKCLGRLVPMLSFLLLSLPVLAVCYSLGGVSTGLLFCGAYALLITCLQIGALAVMCSSFFGTTIGALLATYLAGAMAYLGWPLLLIVLAPGGDRFGEEVMFAFLPMYGFLQSGDDVAGMVVYSIPVLAMAAVAIILARVFLIRRAFVLRRSVLRSVFTRLDAFWNRANRLTGGVVLIKDRRTLPDFDPVAWRETNRMAMGKASHLIRLLLMLELPTLLALAIAWGTRSVEPLQWVVLLFLWPMVALILAFRSVGVFVSERTNRTMELLLATPMTGPQIVRQKVRALWRLVAVLAAPLLTAVLAQALLHDTFRTRYWQPGPVTYLAAELPAIALYLPLIVWFSVYVALRMGSRPRATIAVLGLLVTWCVGMPVILALGEAYGGLYIVSMTDLGYLLSLLSPAAILALAEQGGLGGPSTDVAPVVPVIINCVLYGGLLFFFRSRCLRRSDAYLGRVAAVPTGPPAGDDADTESPHAQQAVS